MGQMCEETTHECPGVDHPRLLSSSENANPTPDEIREKLMRYLRESQPPCEKEGVHVRTPMEDILRKGASS